jgi:hypothetical protein
MRRPLEGQRGWRNKRIRSAKSTSMIEVGIETPVSPAANQSMSPDHRYPFFSTTIHTMAEAITAMKVAKEIRIVRKIFTSPTLR